MFCLLETVHPLTEEANKYYQQYLEKTDEPSDVTVQEMYSFLAINIEMCNDQQDTLKDY
jgi:hypothetical protein